MNCPLIYHSDAAGNDITSAIALATDSLILFRIFNYPPQSNLQGQSWGVGEHTDYGLLAILKQDDLGGLQVKTKSGRIDAPPTASQVDFIGLDVSTHLPRRVTREELVGAVSLVCDVSDLAPPEVAIDRWDDCALPARI